MPPSKGTCVSMSSVRKVFTMGAIIPTCILAFSTIGTDRNVISSIPSSPRPSTCTTTPSSSSLSLYKDHNSPISSFVGRIRSASNVASASSVMQDVVSRTSETGTASSTLNMICDERKEFELKLGKAMDTLRKDYPDILTVAPDFSIFHEDLEVVDPSGVTIHGIKQYEASFSVVRALVGFFYCPTSSGLTFRLVYDWARNNIRISWNTVLVPRSIYGGEKNQLHVDGISVYEIDRQSGLITQHRVEHLLVNGNTVHAPKGVVHALTNEVVQGGVPVGGIGGYGIDQIPQQPQKGFRLQFQSPLFVNPFKPRTSLFTMASSADNPNNKNQNNNFDQDAFQRKNDTRKKYGLPALSVEEFLQIEDQVRQLEMVQKEKQQTAQQIQAAELAAQEKKKKRGNFLRNMMGDVLTDTCESNFDCERPMVCCDFVFKKVCCASGMKVGNGIPGEMQTLRVPIPRLPRGGPDGMPGDMY